MKLVNVNDTTRAGPQSKEEKKIIYSLTWHPNDTKVAMTTVNGNLMIFDALKNKMLSHITPHKGEPSFKVAWNKLDPSHLVMSSANFTAYLLKL